MNLLFVTVGTSAIENQEVGQAPDRQDNKLLLAEIVRYNRSTSRTRERWPKLFSDLVEAHKRYWDGMDGSYTFNPDNRKQTSAELSSTMALLHDFKAKGIQPPDKLVLLASDTEEGEFAAQVNEATFRALLPWISLAVTRVKNLDERFSDFSQSIGQSVNEYRESGADNVVFNITGGYKGAIPAITALAISGGWTLYYQHERSGDGAYLRVEGAGLHTEPRPFGRIWA